jgi:hypothetical protein
MVDFLYLMPFAFHFSRMRVAGRRSQVVNPSAAFAQEMGMRGSDGIVARISPVYGQSLYRSVFAQQFQCIVDSCLGERGDGGRQSHIDFIHRRMRAMFHQVAHDGYPLYGGLYVVGLQSFYNIHWFQVCNYYIFNFVAKKRLLFEMCKCLGVFFCVFLRVASISLCLPSFIPSSNAISPHQKSAIQMLSDFKLLEADFQGMGNLLPRYRKEPVEK